LHLAQLIQDIAGDILLIY